jgi:hypothetical protein
VNAVADSVREVTPGVFEVAATATVGAVHASGFVFERGPDGVLRVRDFSLDSRPVSATIPTFRSVVVHGVSFELVAACVDELDEGNLKTVLAVTNHRTERISGSYIATFDSTSDGRTYDNGSSACGVIAALCESDGQTSKPEVEPGDTLDWVIDFSLADARKGGLLHQRFEETPFASGTFELDLRLPALTKTSPVALGT